MSSLNQRLREAAPDGARALEFLAVPLRFTRTEALRMLRHRLTPERYALELLDVLIDTGTLSSRTYMRMHDQTRLPILHSLLRGQMSAVARAWLADIEAHCDGGDRRLDVAYLGLLAADERRTAILRTEYETAEHDAAFERQAYVARLVREGSSQYDTLPGGSRASLYFILGMTAYKRGHRRQAARDFRRVIQCGSRSMDEAIAAHLLANIICDSQYAPEDAESLYKSSIAIGESQRAPFHVAQVEHSLANFLKRTSRGRRDEEAEALYAKSIATGSALGHMHHVAKVEHSLANLLAKSPTRREAAQSHYERSLDYLRLIGDTLGVAQVAYTYGKFLCDLEIDLDKGRQLLKESLDLNLDLQTGHEDHVRKAYDEHSE